MSDVVARAKAALEGVTEGPWDAPAQLLGSPCTTVFGAGRKHVLYHAGGYTDAQFVAAARTLVPELVAEVERLDSELTFARDGFDIRPMTETESNLMTQVLGLRRELAAARFALADVTAQR